VTDKNVREVQLRFGDEVAGLIRERLWHPTQFLKDVAGGVRLTMTCSQDAELISWILSWAEHVVVENPSELATLVTKRHRAAAGLEKMDRKSH
jgi:predicted DNA-binding transcriptional regulator YafY